MPKATAYQPLSSTPVLSWASDTVLPNETVIVAGSGFHNCTSLTFQPHSNGTHAPIVVPLSSASDSALMAVLPATASLAVFDVSVRCGSTDSNALRVNAPRILWAQVISNTKIDVLSNFVIFC